jgi:hypothetical protein
MREHVKMRISILIVAFLLASGTAFFAAPEAGAYRTWCRSDPIVIIDGVLVDIFVAGPLEAYSLVTGPTEIVVSVPPGVDAWLVVSDIGFGQGELVRFEESKALKVRERGIDVKVEVFVPTTEDIPVRVEFAPRIVGLLAPTSAEGASNDWVTLKART